MAPLEDSLYPCGQKLLGAPVPAHEPLEQGSELGWTLVKHRTLHLPVGSLKWALPR